MIRGSWNELADVATDVRENLNSLVFRCDTGRWPRYSLVEKVKYFDCYDLDHGRY